MTWLQQQLARERPDTFRRTAVVGTTKNLARAGQVIHFLPARSGRGGSVAERKTMIDRDHGLSLGRQAKALGISRGSVYYLPRPASDADLAFAIVTRTNGVTWLIAPD